MVSIPTTVTLLLLLLISTNGQLTFDSCKSETDCEQPRTCIHAQIPSITLESLVSSTSVTTTTFTSCPSESTSQTTCVCSQMQTCQTSSTCSKGERCSLVVPLNSSICTSCNAINTVEIPIIPIDVPSSENCLLIQVEEDDEDDEVLQQSPEQDLIPLDPSMTPDSNDFNSPLPDMPTPLAIPTVTVSFDLPSSVSPSEFPVIKSVQPQPDFSTMPIPMSVPATPYPDFSLIIPFPNLENNDDTEQSVSVSSKPDFSFILPSPMLDIDSIIPSSSPEEDEEDEGDDSMEVTPSVDVIPTTTIDDSIPIILEASGNSIMTSIVDNEKDDDDDDDDAGEIAITPQISESPVPTQTGDFEEEEEEDDDVSSDGNGIATPQISTTAFEDSDIMTVETPVQLPSFSPINEITVPQTSISFSPEKEMITPHISSADNNEGDDNHPVQIPVFSTLPIEPTASTTRSFEVEEIEEQVCMDAKLLDHLPEHHLVYSKPGKTSFVLCDGNESCATASHIVIYNNIPMSMKTYCQSIDSCIKRVMKVNNLRYKHKGIKIDSRTKDLLFTAHAARFQSSIEEFLLVRLVKFGF